MAGKAIDNSATGVLILIIPIALALVILFKAWPAVLLLVLLGGTISVWQRYQWQQWSQQIDPIFHQLIDDNRGCVTPLDLSIKANLSGTAAKRYLDRKADEFGARLLEYEDKGTAYYFITANTLGVIFDDSAPDQELERQERETTTVSPSSDGIAIDRLERKINELSTGKAIEAFSAHLDELPHNDRIAATQVAEELSEPLPEKRETSDEPLPKTHRILQSLIQSELARRLDVHSSTVMKRRDQSDFAEWSRSRDPEGIAWEYSPDTREFYPLEMETK
ncbi:MAG TPA: hypothetical protein V6D28_26870 [Leptolyngbyaceae cyanobacterium]